MKSDFKTKLIQHMLNKKNGEKGFTLIELLVVIIIIGILAAIALPSFLNQTSKAKQTEAKTYVSTVNKSQQAYYTEKTTFAPNITTLSLGTPTTTDNYTYTSTGTSSVANSPATSLKATLKGYMGQTIVGSDASSQQVSSSLICEAKDPAAGAAGAITGAVTAQACASGDVQVK